MLLERLLGNLDLTLEPFAVCEVSSGWRLRLERLDWVTVHFVLSGSGRLRLGSGPAVALARHSLALVPARRQHVIEVGDPVEHEASATRPDLRRDRLDVFEAGPHHADELEVVCGRIQARYEGRVGLFDHLDDALVLEFADSPEMVAIFERLLQEERQRTPSSVLMMNALMSEALILLFRRLCLEPECPLPWLTALEDRRLAEPLSMMLEHPEHDHTVGSLAAAASMSRTAFSETFKARLERSPMTHLREIRLRRAAGLLRTTQLTIDQVAERSGYSSRSQFSRAFTAQFGVSPSSFRRSPPGA